MFDIIEFITQIFKKDKVEDTRYKAKERLKLVLVTDRASISPQMMDNLKEELIQVISRYMTIDISSMEIGLERKDGSVALAANIPIVDVKRNPRKQAQTEMPKEQSSIPVEKIQETKTKAEEKTKETTIKQTAPAVTKSTKSEMPKLSTVETKSAEKPPVVESKSKQDAQEKPDQKTGKKKSKKSVRRFQTQAGGKSLRKRTDS
jgi:cell division topological specificity factor